MAVVEAVASEEAEVAVVAEEEEVQEDLTKVLQVLSSVTTFISTFELNNHS